MVSVSRPNRANSTVQKYDTSFDPIALLTDGPNAEITLIIAAAVLRIAFTPLYRNRQLFAARRFDNFKHLGNLYMFID
jgi:hypothetical protein